MNLACVGPLPPLSSGVADYTAALLPHLRPYFSQIVAVVDEGAPQVPSGLLDGVYHVRDGADWWSGRQVVPLYQMGNNVRYHRAIYYALQRFPGITALHDGNLLPFVEKLTLSRGNQARFFREIGFERGWKETEELWLSLRRTSLSLDACPMLARIARTSLGVIVHSQCLRDRVLDSYPQARVAVIPHLNLMPPDLPPVSRDDAKTSLGLDSDSLLIGAFGFIVPAKRLDKALRAFARVRGEFPQARFVCVGEVSPDYDFGTVLHELGLGDVVQVTGYVSIDTLRCYLRAVDVGINLRHPTWGESSGALVRLMACGTPTIVTDAGAFSELPDEMAVKVPFDQDEVPAIEAALRSLLSDERRRLEIGVAAREYVVLRGDPAQVAKQYASFIRDVVTGGNCA